MSALAKHRILPGAIAACLVFAQALRSQSTVTVRDIEFRGDLGVPAPELEEHLEFLKGHPMEESEILKQTSSAISGDLRRHGFWKANVAPAIRSAKDSRNQNKDAVLEVTIRAGLQYRLKDVSFSGLASEFPAHELRETCSLQQGDIADGNELGITIAKLDAFFKKRGKNYSVVPTMVFDDAAHTASVTFDVLQ